MLFSPAPQFEFHTSPAPNEASVHGVSPRLTLPITRLLAGSMRKTNVERWAETQTEPPPAVIMAGKLGMLMRTAPRGARSRTPPED